MIKNVDILKKFEDEFVRNSSLSYDEASDILDAMWEEGVELGVLPPADPLEGIDVDMQVAAVFSACLGK